MTLDLLKKRQAEVPVFFFTAFTIIAIRLLYLKLTLISIIINCQ